MPKTADRMTMIDWLRIIYFHPVKNVSIINGNEVNWDFRIRCENRMRTAEGLAKPSRYKSKAVLGEGGCLWQKRNVRVEETNVKGEG